MHKNYCDWPGGPCDCGENDREFKIHKRVRDGYDSGYYWGKKASRDYYKKVVKKLKEEIKELKQKLKIESEAQNEIS